MKLEKATFIDAGAKDSQPREVILQAARDKLTAGPAINKGNAAVLDWLLANFGKPYREAYANLNMGREYP